MVTFRIFLLVPLYSLSCFWETNGEVVKSSVTSIGTWLVVQGKENHATTNCNDACLAVGLICNFSNIHLIPSNEMKTRIREMLPNEKCHASADDSTIIATHYRYHDEPTDPTLNTVNNCSNGFEKIGYAQPYPICETAGTSIGRRICQCGNNNVTTTISPASFEVLKSSITSIGTNLVVQAFQDRFNTSCNDACNTVNMICNFSNIHMMAVEEIKSKIKEMLPDYTCHASDDNSTILTTNYKYHDESTDPTLNIINECSNGFERIGYTQAYPVCETTGTSMGRRICQCGNSNVTNAVTSIGTQLVVQEFSTSGQKSCTDACTAAGLTCSFIDFEKIPLDELKIVIPNVLPREICHITYSDKPSVLISNSWKNYAKSYHPSFNKNNHCVSGYLGISEDNLPNCFDFGTTKFARICPCI